MTDKKIKEKIVEDTTIKQPKITSKEKECPVLVQRGDRCFVNFDGITISVTAPSKDTYSVLTVEYVGEIGKPDFKIKKIK